MCLLVYGGMCGCVVVRWCVCECIMVCLGALVYDGGCGFVDLWCVLVYYGVCGYVYGSEFGCILMYMVVLV